MIYHNEQFRPQFLQRRNFRQALKQCKHRPVEAFRFVYILTVGEKTFWCRFISIHMSDEGYHTAEPSNKMERK